MAASVNANTQEVYNLLTFTCWGNRGLWGRAEYLRGPRVSFNVEAVNAFDTKRAGWFVIASNTTKDTWKALEEYRGRDTVEKSFDDIKNDLDLDLLRLRIHSAEAMDGRVFIQFIALIIESSMRSFIESDPELAQMSLREVLNEMSSFRELSIEGHRKSTPSEATQLQRQITDCFGFTLPVCVQFPSGIWAA